MRKLYVPILLILLASMILSACAAPTPQVVEKQVIQTQVVTQVQTQVVEKVQTQVVEKQVVVTATPEPPQGPLMPIRCPAMKPCTSMVNSGARLLAGIRSPTATTTPWRSRSRTTPASSCSRPRTCTTCSTARCILCWRMAPLRGTMRMTEITFKIKPAAKWNDGTPVTADDVAYTWATPVKYNTPVAAANKDFIDTIEAKDPQTVVIKAKLGADGKAVNPLLVNAYVSTNYVVQKAWTQKLEERVGGDATKLMADPAEDVAYSGPYHKFFADDTKVVYVRDDNYWGQDASMWGKLPAPKYLAHTIFKDNAAGSVALAQGEVDVSQQFNSNVQVLWEKLRAARLHLPARGALRHRRQPPDRLLQPEVPRSGPALRPQGHRHGR